MSTDDLTMDLVPTGLLSGTLKSAVEHILDELACHGYSNYEIVKISVLLAQAALDSTMIQTQATLDNLKNETKVIKQLYKLNSNLDEV